MLDTIKNLAPNKMGRAALAALFVFTATPSAMADTSIACRVQTSTAKHNLSNKDFTGLIQKWHRQAEKRPEKYLILGKFAELLKDCPELGTVTLDFTKLEHGGCRIQIAENAMYHDATAADLALAEKK